ncbi:SAM-dependent methyltransferase [Lacticaseibacillus sp. GG6-2]
MDYWQRLLAMTADIDHPQIQQQVAAMTQFRASLQHHQLPERPLMRLGVTPQVYAELLLAKQPEARIRTIDALFRNFRQYIAYHYGMWSFVTQSLFATWQDLFGQQRYLEVAAGNGYISAGLRQAGNTVITTDPLTWTSENVTGRTPLVPITALTANAALWTYGASVDAVVMAWSPDKDLNDVHFLHLLRQHFPQLACFVIGERAGATNSRLFWQEARLVTDRRLLPLNRALPQFDAINERIYLVR